MLTPDGFSAMAEQFLNKTSPASGGLQLTATLGGSPRRQRLFHMYNIFRNLPCLPIYLQFPPGSGQVEALPGPLAVFTQSDFAFTLGPVYP